jgi:hypothetical protein
LFCWWRWTYCFKFFSDVAQNIDGFLKTLWFAKTPSVDFCHHSPQDRTVLELMVLLFRAIGLAYRGHQEVVLENRSDTSFGRCSAGLDIGRDLEHRLLS